MFENSYAVIFVFLVHKYECAYVCIYNCRMRLLKCTNCIYSEAIVQHKPTLITYGCVYVYSSARVYARLWAAAFCNNLLRHETHAHSTSTQYRISKQIQTLAGRHTYIHTYVVHNLPMNSIYSTTCCKWKVYANKLETYGILWTLKFANVVVICFDLFFLCWCIAQCLLFYCDCYIVVVVIVFARSINKLQRFTGSKKRSAKNIIMKKGSNSTVLQKAFNSETAQLTAAKTRKQKSSKKLRATEVPQNNARRCPQSRELVYIHMNKYITYICIYI